MLVGEADLVSDGHHQTVGHQACDDPSVELGTRTRTLVQRTEDRAAPLPVTSLEPWLCTAHPG